MTWLTKARNWAAKALSSDEMRHSTGQAVFLTMLDAPDVDTMARDVGDGTGSDVLMTPIRWLQRAMSQSPLMVIDEEGAAVPTNALQALLDKPNEFYSMQHLLAGTVFSLVTDGNGYWIPAQSSNSRTSELWYAPHDTMEPMWPKDGKEFISHYRYRPTGGTELRLEVDEVIHFRESFDPQNARKGLSPLKGLLREIWTDNEAAVFTAALLRNGGVPGLMLSPKGDHTISKEDADATKAIIDTKFTREGRGRTIVMAGETNLEQFGFTPQQLDLSPLRNIAEERVTAAVGVPAAVVGFGAGLQSTKVGATMRELRQLAWHNGVIPLQEIIAAEILRSLGEEFKAPGITFDRSEVAALRENEDSIARRVERLVRAGILTRAEAKAELGIETVPADDVYLLPLSTVEVPASGTEKAKLAPVVPFDRSDGILWHCKCGKGGVEFLDGELFCDSCLPGAKAKHHGSLLEQRLIETAPHREAPEQVASFARRIDTIRRNASRHFEAALIDVFERLGVLAERAAREVLGVGELASAVPGETKQDDPLEADAMFSALDLAEITRELQQAIEGGYQVLAEEIAEALGTSFGIDFVLTEQAQLEILREGGLRAGLIDLDAQTHDALFDALAEGRAEGLAGDNLARRIRERIEAGPWRDVATRARVIARTEGAHAANTATLQAARSMEGVEMMMVHDNRTGHDDDVCSAIDGRVVTIQEAEAMGLAHPNCTRSFSPIPALLLQEMGL